VTEPTPTPEQPYPAQLLLDAAQWLVTLRAVVKTMVREELLSLLMAVPMVAERVRGEPQTGQGGKQPELNLEEPAT
jgi:hypothetical protein